MGAPVNQRVTVTTSKILQGSGKITVDGVELGSYEGGVEITKTQTEMNVESELALGTVDSEIKSVEYKLKTNLEESTLENLALAWGMSTSSVLSGTSSKVLQIEMPATMREVNLTVEGQSATNRDKTRTYQFNRCVTVGSVGTKLQRGTKQVTPIEFKVLMIAGTTRFGTVTENTITA